MQDNNELIKKSGEHFKDNINFLFIAKENLIIVTKDDKVYQFDGQLNKTYSSIAYSSDEYVVKQLIEKSIVEELCDKNVVDIKSGKKHTIARTSDGKVYIWGLNDSGVLGNGFNDKIYRPQLNEYLNHLYIIDMSCGAKHTLVLTSSGNIYGWGWNKFGQIGYGSDCEYQLIPFKMNGLICEKFKAISCGAYHSMALTKDGRVFCCGYNAFGQLGDRILTDSHKLKPIHMNNIIIEKISCGFSHSILLSNKEEIYVFGNYNNELDIKESEPQKLYSYKFCDIATHWSQDFFSALSMNQIYYIWGQFEPKGGIEYEPKQTTYKSFNEIFINYWQITYQSIEGMSSQPENDSIANKKLLDIKRESHNSKEFDCKADKFMNFGEKFIRNGYYERNFDEKQKIGEGSYGQVFEVGFKNQVNKSFAIKKITFRFDYMEKMFETLGVYDSVSKLKHKNIVSTKDFWFEKDMFDEKIMIFYILMELCMLNLSDFIDQVGQAYFSPYLKYHLSSIIFIQSLRGVDYLHKQNPPIIHRDLNPCNILLKLKENKRVSVKIAEFQSVTIHKYAEQLHELDVGNIEYMAPEVENSGKYDTKADIYSLGKVLRDLFDINSDDKSNIPTNLTPKYAVIIDLYERMTSTNVDVRPSCEHILHMQNEWLLNNDDLSEILNLEDLHSTNETLFLQIVNQMLNQPIESYIDTTGQTTKFMNIQSSFSNLKGSEQIRINGHIYKVLNAIGEGGSSKVYQVYDEDQQKTFALKVVDYHNVECFKEVVNNYKYEINILSKLNKCSHVVHLHDHQHIESEKKILLLLDKGDINMEILFNPYVENELKTRERDPDEIRFFFKQMVKAVEEIHEHNVVHSDLKPENFILIKGKVKLIDFGISSIINENQTSVIKQTNIYLGTVDYMSPETLTSRTNTDNKQIKYNMKTDIWSLGCILYDMASGHTPFQFCRNKTRDIKNPNFKINYSDIKIEAKGLVDCIKRCLQYDPNKRPTASELLRDPFLSSE